MKKGDMKGPRIRMAVTKEAMMGLRWETKNRMDEKKKKDSRAR